MRAREEVRSTGEQASERERELYKGERRGREYERLILVRDGRKMVVSSAPTHCNKERYRK